MSSRLRRFFTTLAAIVLALILTDPAHARQLGTAVTIAGADATNATISAQVAPGPLGLDLDMAVLHSLKEESASGSMMVSNLRATTAPGETITLTAMTRDGSQRSSDASPFAVTLTRGGAVRLRLMAEGLRPSTAYAGQSPSAP